MNDRRPKTSKIDESLLDFSSLSSATKIGVQTARWNFDWENPSQVSYKVEEEWQELKEEMVLQGPRLREELGDLLFSIAQLARHLGIDPEEALREANGKFIRRFKKMEDLLAAESRNMEEMSQGQLDEYWNRVKRDERRN